MFSFKTGAGSRTFKIIDLGAAADLRVGINYIPKEFLLDPRYFLSHNATATIRDYGDNFIEDN
jgi:hypothetical protein